MLGLVTAVQDESFVGFGLLFCGGRIGLSSAWGGWLTLGAAVTVFTLTSGN
jgi:hypothetical protein